MKEQNNKIIIPTTEDFIPQNIKDKLECKFINERQYEFENLNNYKIIMFMTCSEKLQTLNAYTQQQIMQYYNEKENTNIRKIKEETLQLIKKQSPEIIAKRNEEERIKNLTIEIRKIIRDENE